MKNIPKKLEAFKNLWVTEHMDEKGLNNSESKWIVSFEKPQFQVDSEVDSLLEVDEPTAYALLFMINTIKDGTFYDELEKLID